MLARPRRTATIRTRLDVARLLERVAGLIDDPASKGTGRWLAGGYFVGGAVGSRDFQLDYYFNSAKNSQTYDVEGTVQDNSDWRLVRLTVEARDPWMSGWAIAVILSFVSGYVWAGAMTVMEGVGAAATVLGLFALVNLLYVPKVVTSRVSRLLAGAVDGSVFQAGSWEVPRGPQWW